MFKDIKKIKREVICTESRKLKKRILHRNFIKQINFTVGVKYNLFHYFNCTEKIFLNHKLLNLLFTTESGVLFS